MSVFFFLLSAAPFLTAAPVAGERGEDWIVKTDALIESKVRMLRSLVLEDQEAGPEEIGEREHLALMEETISDAERKAALLAMVMHTSRDLRFHAAEEGLAERDFADLRAEYADMLRFAHELRENPSIRKAAEMIIESIRLEKRADAALKKGARPAGKPLPSITEGDRRRFLDGRVRWKRLYSDPNSKVVGVSNAERRQALRSLARELEPPAIPLPGE